MSDKTEKRLDLAKAEHIKAAVDRAEAMLNRARSVNKAHYAHGINSTYNEIEFYLKGVRNGTKGDYGGLQLLHDKVMKLGGYLYSLENNL